MASEISEAPASGLGKLLQDDRFIVPTHQRDYSWKIDDVALLLDDIESAYERKDEQYFVGLMVFMNGNDTGQIVLDGQQRLATAVIFFSAVRNWLKQFSEFEEDAQKIEGWFIGRSELRKRKAEPRIVLNSANHQTFEDFIVKSVPVSHTQLALKKMKKYDRNRRMLEASVYCHDRIAEMAKGSDPEQVANRLCSMVNYFRDAVGVVCLNVKDEDNAFTIFETLNDRGMDLSPLDLVKNFLFRRASAQSKQRLRDMEDRWVQMMSTLSTVKSDNFLKAFWTSRHGRVQATNLFGKFKRQYDAPDDALAVSVEMLKVAEAYAALESSDDPVWAPYSTEARERVRSLKLLGARQAHPIMLAALERFDPPEMERLLRLLETVIVRYQLIGGERTGKLEIECARVAQAVYNGEIIDSSGRRAVKRASDVFRELREIYPSDQNFEASFVQATESNHQKVIFILRTIEREARLRKNQAKAAENEPGKLTLEHVFPKNPGAEWSALIKEDSSFKEDCLYRLGNLCLLIAGENRNIGRMAFPQKRLLYQNTDIEITKEVGRRQEWNRSAIDEQQRYLAGLAVSAWRFQ
jgi:hypothetical protein